MTDRGAPLGFLRSGQHVDVAKDVLDVYDLLASMRDEGAGLDYGFLVTSAEIIRVAARLPPSGVPAHHETRG